MQLEQNPARCGCILRRGGRIDRSGEDLGRASQDCCVKGSRDCVDGSGKGNQAMFMGMTVMVSQAVVGFYILMASIYHSEFTRRIPSSWLGNKVDIKHKINWKIDIPHRH